MALVVGVVYGWTRSLRGAAACFAAVLALAAAHPAVLSSDWMPYLYVLAYIAFLVAAASVAAGRGQDAWVLALTGWFLIHGHASFLFFVPVICCASLASVLWPHRHRLGASVRSFFATQRRVWVPVVIISAVFALPIVADLVLHWPGQFGKYLAFASSSKSGGHSVAQAVRAALWYWWPHRGAWALPVAGYAVAVAVTRWLAPSSLRRFLAALLAVNALSSLAFLYYAVTGIDILSRHYEGYFYWSAPVLTLLVIALGVVEAMPAAAGRGHRRWSAVLLLAALAIAPDTHTSTNSSDPAVLTSGQDTDPRCPVPSPRSPRVQRPDDRLAVRPPSGATSPASSCRPSGLGCGRAWQPRVHVHDDQPVHLHEVRYRRRPGLLAAPRCPRGSTVLARLRQAVVTVGP